MARTPSANGTVDASQLLSALRAVKKGDFTARLPGNQTGVAGAIAEAFNDIVELLQNTTGEFARIGTVVGKEGRIKQRASLGPVTGSWSAWIDSVNTLIGDVVHPDLKFDSPVGGNVVVPLRQRALNFDRALRRFQRAAEFNQEGVADGLDLCAVKPRENFPQQPAMLLQQLERELIIALG